MEIILTGRLISKDAHALEFEWKDMPGAGFSFPCDEQGTLLQEEIRPEARHNLSQCLKGEIDVIPQGVKIYHIAYWQPALGRCSCGSIVELRNFTNTCSCEREYNSSGQLLAPRSQWEDPWDEDGIEAPR